MTATLDPPTPPVTGLRYFRWCVMYELPLRPTEPVTFAETERLAAFYAACHNPAGRVFQLDKVELVRVSRHPAAVPPPGVAAGTTVYYEVVNPPGGEPHPGDRLDYPATEGLAEYFAGPVEAPGQVATLSRLRRETVFTEWYLYGPAGRLRERIRWAPDRRTTYVTYGPDGKPFAEWQSAAGDERLTRCREAAAAGDTATAEWELKFALVLATNPAEPFQVVTRDAEVAHPV